jgi:hypothetical protein
MPKKPSSSSPSRPGDAPASTTALAAALAALAPEAVDDRVIAEPLVLAEVTSILVKLLAEPVIAAAFGQLGPAYPPATVEILREAVGELRRISDARKNERALESTATLPASLVDEAIAVRADVRRLLEYHFEDDPVLGPILVEIRKGRGYVDLGSDLARYATILEAQKALLVADRRYQADAATRAQALSDTIFDALGRPSDAARDAELRRLQTVVTRAYDRTIAGASLALFDQPDQAARFRPLGTALRAATPTKAKPKKATPAEG